MFAPFAKTFMVATMTASRDPAFWEHDHYNNGHFRNPVPARLTAAPKPPARTRRRWFGLFRRRKAGCTAS